MPISNFEVYLVKAINSFFFTSKQAGVAYRLRQAPFATQYVDVLVDSPIPKYNLAVEAKSMNLYDKDGREKKQLYFKGAFTIDKKGKHQVTRIDEFCENGGRRGFLAVRIRRGKAKPSYVHFLPWAVVSKRFENGRAGIPLDTIRTYPQLFKTKGCFNFDSVINV